MLYFGNRIKLRESQNTLNDNRSGLVVNGIFFKVILHHRIVFTLKRNYFEKIILDLK